MWLRGCVGGENHHLPPVWIPACCSHNHTPNYRCGFVHLPEIIFNNYLCVFIDNFCETWDAYLPEWRDNFEFPDLISPACSSNHRRSRAFFFFFFCRLAAVATFWNPTEVHVCLWFLLNYSLSAASNYSRLAVAVVQARSQGSLRCLSSSALPDIPVPDSVKQWCAGAVR